MKKENIKLIALLVIIFTSGILIIALSFAAGRHYERMIQEAKQKMTLMIKQEHEEIEERKADVYKDFKEGKINDPATIYKYIAITQQPLIWFIVE